MWDVWVPGTPKTTSHMMGLSAALISQVTVAICAQAVRKLHYIFLAHLGNVFADLFTGYWSQTLTYQTKIYSRSSLFLPAVFLVFLFASQVVGPILLNLADYVLFFPDTIISMS